MKGDIFQLNTKSLQLQTYMIYYDITKYIIIILLYYNLTNIYRKFVISDERKKLFIDSSEEIGKRVDYNTYSTWKIITLRKVNFIL